MNSVTICLLTDGEGVSRARRLLLNGALLTRADTQHLPTIINITALPVLAEPL